MNLPASSSLVPLLEIGNIFKTTHRHFTSHGIDTVVYLGDHGTRSRNFHLIGGTTPSNITGKNKAINFSKRKLALGMLDHHFTHCGKVKLVQKVDDPTKLRNVLISSKIVEETPIPQTDPVPTEIPPSSEVTGEKALEIPEISPSGGGNENPN